MQALFSLKDDQDLFILINGQTDTYYSDDTIKDLCKYVWKCMVCFKK